MKTIKVAYLGKQSFPTPVLTVELFVNSSLINFLIMQDTMYDFSTFFGYVLCVM